MPTAEPDIRRYADVRAHIPESALLLYRACDWRGRWISGGGRSRYSHAAKACWWGADLFVCEVIEWYGGRAVTLSSQVARYPRRIDVYDPAPNGRWPEYDAEGSSEFMRRLCGCPYGWGGIFTAACLHLPGVRQLIDVEAEEENWDRRPPFCSQAVAMRS